MSFKDTIKKSIPDTEHSFILDLQGNLTKYRYVGDFTCKIATHKDKSSIGRHKAMLNGEFPLLDIKVAEMHHMIAFLRYTLIKFPDWWSESDYGFSLYDSNVVEALYDKVLAFEEKWYNQIWGVETPKEETSTS